MRRIFLFFLFFVFACSAVSAAKIDIDGELTVAGYLYEKETGHDRGYGEAELLLPLAVTFPEHPAWRLVAEPKIRLDTESLATGIDRPHKRERAIVGVENAYVEYLKGGWGGKIGYQIADWSVTDTVSPSDNLNPLDLTFIPEWERRSAPMATVYYGYDTYAELAVKPFFSSSILPKYRWEESAPGVNILDSRTEEDKFQFGARVGTTWERTDLQLSFYHGYANNPYGETAGVGPKGIKIRPRYSEEDVISLGMVRDLPFWGLLSRVDAGYFHQDRGDNFVQYVVGVEKTWQNVATPGDRAFALLQFCGEEVAEEDEDIMELTDFRRVFKNALIGKAHYQFGQGSPWKIKFRGSYNLEEGDGFLEPALQWSGGNWKAEAGFQFVTGPEDTFWGGYNDNDSFFLKLTFKF
jgi:hypothetical protein